MNRGEIRRHAAFEASKPGPPKHDFIVGFMEGAEWADTHPNGFINYFPNDKSFTNKEFQELLQQYPEDAVICVECCNPRAIIYDEKNNLIRID